MMEKTQSKTATAIGYGVSDEGKPVAPFPERQFSNAYNSLDPSSYLRADRYPIPASFENRSNPRERDFS